TRSAPGRWGWWGRSWPRCGGRCRWSWGVLSSGAPTLRRGQVRGPRGQPWSPGAGKTLGPAGVRSCHDVEVTGRDTRELRAAVPLLLVSAVVVMVTVGAARGLWFANLH